MAMKWVKILDKEPQFGAEYILLDKDENWFKGHLQETKENPKGKEYKFYNVQSGESVDNVTHFMKIDLPKKEFTI